MTETNDIQEQRSPLHAILSLIIPGAGQAFAGEILRGISILVATLILGFLSIWTSAQRARFPDMGVSTRIFVAVLLQCLALLALLLIVRYLILRSMQGDASADVASQGILGVGYIAIILIASRPILDLAGHTPGMLEVHETTLLLAAASLAGLWLWQSNDAALLGAGNPVGSWSPG